MSFYDNQDGSMKTMHERCREYYAPEEFVVVMNIDTEPFTYMQQRPENVQINNPSAMTKELYYLKDPDVITLTPGQTRMVPAYEADNFIKQLTDKMVLRNRQKVIEGGNNPSESAMDPQTQHKYIQAIFQGKKDFMNEYNQQVSMPVQQANQIERELLGGQPSQTAQAPAGVPSFAVPPAS